MAVSVSSPFPEGLLVKTTAKHQNQENLLKNVIAYVEVRSEYEDRSEAISYYLQILGARISKYFNRKVTHVVFKNGRLSTYKKATEWKVHLVAVSWIERCKVTNSIVPECEFPAIIPEQYTSPFFCGKVKKFKSMVAKTHEFDAGKSLQQRFRRREKLRIKRECREFLKLTPELRLAHLNAQLTPRIKRLKSDENQTDRSIITPERQNEQAERRLSSAGSSLSDDNVGSDDNSWNIPLAERLLNRSLSESITKTPISGLDTIIKSLTIGTQIPKRKLFTTEEKMLNFTPDANLSKNTSSDTPTNTRQQNTSLSEFQLKANKENQVKINKIVKDFDNETPRNKNVQRVTRRSILSPCFSRNPSVVLTSVRKEESDTVKAIVTGIGRFDVVDVVDETTTHVVCGNPRRTLNVLFGLARGCWILSQDWVYKSLEKNEWLPEREFELSTEFPGCKDLRFERRKSSGYRQNIFRELGPVFIGGNISLPRKKLQQLIDLCGGRVVNQCKSASIFIGCDDSKNGAISLTEKWILDSITHNKLQPMENFTTEK